jgi:hypothetical protein
MKAAGNGQAKIVKIVLSAGADVNHSNDVYLSCIASVLKSHSMEQQL